MTVPVSEGGVLAARGLPRFGLLSSSAIFSRKRFCTISICTGERPDVQSSIAPSIAANIPLNSFVVITVVPLLLVDTLPGLFQVAPAPMAKNHQGHNLPRLDPVPG
jgi:hypothetical protein